MNILIMLNVPMSGLTLFRDDQLAINVENDLPRTQRTCPGYAGYILLVSIIECTLYDLLCRIQEHVYEKINLETEDINKIKNLELPAKLKNYNDICCKYELLGKNEVNGIYQKIGDLINIRNRVHIQNDKQHQPVDEHYLWTNQQVKNAGEILKYLFLYLTENYPRPDHIHDAPLLDGFPTPWEKL